MIAAWNVGPAFFVTTLLIVGLVGGDDVSGNSGAADLPTELTCPMGYALFRGICYRAAAFRFGVRPFQRQKTDLLGGMLNS